MSTIESVVTGIPYDKAPSLPHLYTNEVIAECESLVGKPFPEDFKWYLLHIGWRKIAWEHRSFPVANKEYIYHLQFEAIEHQAFIINRYKEYLKDHPDQPFYFPLGKASGEINPSVTFQLLVHLTDGTVWAIPLYNKLSVVPLKIADSFTLFLSQITTGDAVRKITSANNEKLFFRLLENYVPVISPTTAAEADQLIMQFFTQPFTLNGTRNVEMQYLSNGFRVEDEQEFAKRAGVFENWAEPTAALPRREIKISAPVLFDEGSYFKWEKHNFYLVTVDSIIGDEGHLKETFLLYHDKVWSMVRRKQASIDNMKIPGLGAFSFDDTNKWVSKEALTPAWSEVPVVLTFDGEENELSPVIIAFMQEILARTDLKPAMEKYLFYDYLSVPDEDNHRTNSSSEVWKELGRNNSILIRRENEFAFSADCSWDQEHGVTVSVKDWKIQ